MSKAYTESSIEWAKVDLKKVPHIVSGEVPGPRSQVMHRRAASDYEGLFKSGDPLSGSV